jgi:Fe-S-cluster containining protein
VTAPRARLAELFVKVDGFFDRVAGAHPGPGGVTCHAGCDACCRRRLTVTGLEARAIAAWIAGLPTAARAALAQQVAAADPDACSALGPDGRCGIYAVRPVVCRTHGLPIRFDAEDGATTLDTCPLNFEGRDLAALPAGDVLRQATVSTLLGALDAADADGDGRPRGERVDLGALVAAALAPTDPAPSR